MKSFTNPRTSIRVLASTLVLSLACVTASAHAQGKAIDNEAVEREMAAKFRPDTAKEARDERKTVHSDNTEAPKERAKR